MGEVRDAVERFLSERFGLEMLLRRLPLGTGLRDKARALKECG